MLHGQNLMTYIIRMKKSSQVFLKFDSESELGMRYLICKQTLGEIFNLEDVGFQLHNPNAHAAKHRNKGRVEHLQCMPWWRGNANGLYYKHMCIINSCIYMQGWLHDAEYLHACNDNFELQQGHVHHT